MAKRINKTTVNYGNLSKVIQKLDKKYSIKVGILGEDGSKPISKDLDMAGLGAVHEFGATINHPGGTPYFIKEDGLAQFVSKEKGSKLPKTKPHQIIIPSRSFLRDSLLTAEGKKALQVWDVTEKEALIEYLNNDTVSADVLANAIGAKALERVSNAFETSGFGNWAPDSQITIKRKKSALPLVNNGDLRGSISYEVKEI